MKKSPFHYTQCGLDYVYLNGGVEWEENDYGNFFTILEVEKLHKLIAYQIIASPQQLRGQELRFLRSQLDISQICLASEMGVSRDAIAKSEAGRDKPLSPTMDRLMRFIYITNSNDKRSIKVVADLLDDIAEQEYQRDLKLHHDKSGWDMPQVA